MHLLRTVLSPLLLAGVLALPLTGCGGILDDIEDIVDELDLDEIEFEINGAVAPIQEVVVVEDDLPDDLIENGDTIVINNNVVVINNIQEDLVLTDLPDSLLLAFENLTGFDAFIRYEADGELQGIFVFDGETLLLDYPCLESVVLLSEDHFDVVTGALIESFDLEEEEFLLGFDFDCGDALVISFEEDAIVAGVDSISLID